jgi:hypothetical protein
MREKEQGERSRTGPFEPDHMELQGRAPFATNLGFFRNSSVEKVRF